MIREWGGRRYWIIGASDPLGKAMARQLSRVGTEVVLSDPQLGDLGRYVDELPGRARALAADPSDRASLMEIVRGVGDFDGLMVLNDLRLPLSADDWDAARLEAMCDANLVGPARCVGAVLGPMLERGSGHIVLSGVGGALRNAPGSLGYAASKDGAAALAKALRADLAETGVEVQLVSLGAIRGRSDDASAMEPEHAARRIFEHMSSDAFEATIGAPAWLARLAG